MAFNPPPLKDGWADDAKMGPRPAWALWFQNIWTLLNSTTSTATGAAALNDARYGSAMFPFTVTQASNLLTGTLAPCKIDFRATALPTGTPVEYNVTANFTLAMTSIAGSLGATTAVPQRLAWALVYAAGTPQIAVANATSGLQMDEANLITTSAIGAGSTSATTWYSTSAIGTPSQYRIIGFCDSTWTTGVGWGSPTTVQPAGGLFLATLGASSIGASGYQQLPSGILIQWGTGNTTGGGAPFTAAVTFPKAFPHSLLSFIPGGNAGAGSTPAAIGAGGGSSTGITVTSSGPTPFFYIAIGF